MLSRTSIATCFFLVLAIPFFGQDGDWKLKNDRDGLRVYYRKPDDSNVNEIRIETRLPGSLSSVIAVLKDVPAYSSWIYNCESAQRLKPPRDQAGLYYCEIDFPWPLSNRDFIARSTIRQDAKSKKVFIEVSGDPDYRPENEGLVRIETLQIHYELTPLRSGEVDMIYELKSEPGGSIPAWLVNMFVSKGPTETIKGLREMIARPEYLTARLPFLDDPCIK